MYILFNIENIYFITKYFNYFLKNKINLSIFIFLEKLNKFESNLKFSHSENISAGDLKYYI